MRNMDNFLSVVDPNLLLVDASLQIPLQNKFGWTGQVWARVPGPQQRLYFYHSRKSESISWEIAVHLYSTCGPGQRSADASGFPLLIVRTLIQPRSRRGVKADSYPMYM